MKSSGYILLTPMIVQHVSITCRDPGALDRGHFESNKLLLSFKILYISLPIRLARLTAIIKVRLVECREKLNENHGKQAFEGSSNDKQHPNHLFHIYQW